MGWCTFCDEILEEINPCYVCSIGKSIKRSPVRLTKGLLIAAGARTLLSFGLAGWFGHVAHLTKKKYTLQQQHLKEEHDDDDGDDNDENEGNQYSDLYDLMLWIAITFLFIGISYLILVIGVFQRSKKCCIIWVLSICPTFISILLTFMLSWSTYLPEERDIYFTGWISLSFVQLIELWIVTLYYQIIVRCEEAEFHKEEENIQISSVAGEGADAEFERILNQRLDYHDELEEAYGFRTSYEFAEAFLKDRANKYAVK